MRSTARSTKLVVKKRKKINAGPRHIFLPSTLSKFISTNFQILEAPAISTAPEHSFLFLPFFPKLSNASVLCLEPPISYQGNIMSAS